MSRRFRLGLVVGKFSPLHCGHEGLIRRAQSACDNLLIVSYSNPELAGYAADRRKAWLASQFPQARRLVVTDELLRETVPTDSEFTTVPENGASAATHRNFCGFLVETFVGTTVDAVFTSEDYGAGFAEHLTRRWSSPVEHVLVDRDRVEFPISGSQVRSDVHAHRNWLSPYVYSTFVQRICLLGGESSGKSVLARAAAERFGTAFVPEYGRELWTAKGGQLGYEDMLAIAKHQVEWEQSAALRAVHSIFCDTSPLTTLFYSLDLFGRADPELQTLALRTYDTYILCATDFEFVQDGTRRDAAFRQRQHDWYREQLANRGVDYLLATGSIEARVDQIAARLVRP